MLVIHEQLTFFPKWRKLKNPGLSEEFKRSLNMCIVKASTAQEEWHTMGLALSRLDRQQQLSRKAFESGAAKLLTQQKIETFFGEENGKKWQNIFEWCQQIELQIITVFHDKKMQVNQVINHLSPKIAALAKVEEFESYDVLKDWLMQNYVDEYLPKTSSEERADRAKLMALISCSIKSLWIFHMTNLQSQTTYNGIGISME